MIWLFSKKSHLQENPWSLKWVLTRFSTKIMISLNWVDTVNPWIPNVKSTSKIMIVFNRISTMPRCFPPLVMLLTRWTIRKVSRDPRIRLSFIKISKKILISITIASNLHHTLKPCTGTAPKSLMPHSTRTMSLNSKILPLLIHVQPYLKDTTPKCQLNRCLPTCYLKPKSRLNTTISLRITKSHLKELNRDSNYKSLSRTINRQRLKWNLTNSV